MQYGTVGGLIAAANKLRTMPLLQFGAIPIVQRIVLTMRQVGIFPIVIVIDPQDRELIHALSPFGVIFLQQEDIGDTELLSSLKLGLRFLHGKCGRVLFSPVNTPMASPQTLRRLLASPSEIVRPSFCGRSGHPVVLADTVIDEILRFDGDGGLRAALQKMSERTEWVVTEDDGVLLTIHNAAQMQAHLQQHNRTLLAPELHLSIRTDEPLLEPRMKLLLFLIANLQSVQAACRCMGLSTATAWNMINRVERILRAPIVLRRQGGRQGGKTALTERGYALACAFRQYEQELRDYAQIRFDELFTKGDLL